MDQHGITELDLEEEVMNLEWFRFKDELQRRLLHQIMYTVVGDREFYKRKNGKGKMVATYCTPAEKVEIEITFDFFNKAMQKELESFLWAFFIKNNLFPPSSGTIANNNESEISEDEFMKITYMMKGMTRHSLRNMIKG